MVRNMARATCRFENQLYNTKNRHSESQFVRLLGTTLRISIVHGLAKEQHSEGRQDTEYGWNRFA